MQIVKDLLMISLTGKIGRADALHLRRVTASRGAGAIILDSAQVVHSIRR
jgi:hypothetical protein